MRWIRDRKLASLTLVWTEKNPSVSNYEPVLSSKALATLLRLSEKKQRELADILFQLATVPFQQGDYLLPDESGRAIHYIITGSYVIGFWADHPVSELRIVEIDLV